MSWELCGTKLAERFYSVLLALFLLSALGVKFVVTIVKRHRGPRGHTFRDRDQLGQKFQVEARSRLKKLRHFKDFEADTHLDFEVNQGFSSFYLGFTDTTELKTQNT